MRRMVSDKDIALLEDLESNNVNSQSISQLYIVNDIKAISGDILSKLKAGDIVLKNTNGQLHAYNVSFKKDGEGICLTYTDASVVETQSYDYTNGAWVYNSEDKTNIINYSAGDNVSINNGVISATDTKYSAGAGIDISDENVISASAGDLYESVLIITVLSGQICIRLITKEQITNSNKISILASELNSKMLPVFTADDLPVVSGVAKIPYMIYGTGNTSANLQLYTINSSTGAISRDGQVITWTASTLEVAYSHKLN